MLDGFDLDRLCELFDYDGAKVAYLRALKKHKGNKAAACREIGRSPSNSTRNWESIKRQARERNYDPGHDAHHPIPPTQTLKGTSTYYPREGEKPAQWVKTRADDIRREEIIERALERFSGNCPVAVPKPYKRIADSEICVVIPLTDLHIGMFCAAEETGTDWDLRLAEQAIVSWISRAILESPDAGTAVLVFLGDVAHYDQLQPVTNRSGHVLAASGTFGQMVDITLGVLHFAIERALEAFETVHLVIAEGNHDETTMITLARAIAHHYQSEARLKVAPSSKPFYAVEFGKILLAFHHGHLVKKDKLPLLMAAEFREAWGRTEHAYIFVGHEHHRDEKDHAGSTVIQLRTLTGRSSYEARHGWLSRREASTFIFHRERGEIGRQTWTPESVL